MGQNTHIKTRKKVLISSVLKPINDTRLHDKIGKSLAKKNTLDVHICGFVSEVPTDTNITFHPLFNFKRLSIKRLTSYWKYTILLLKVKPNIIICNTVELQLINSIYKILFGAEYYYNLEENYFRNIRYTNNFPAVVRLVLAHAVRLKEWMLHPFVDHYFSAEECYLFEMPFIKKKATTLLNKFNPTNTPTLQIKNNSKEHFIFTGTIAEQYGIFDVINLIKSLHAINPKIKLTIIGYCAHDTTLRVLNETIKNHSFIKLIGGGKRVSHRQILEQIRVADFGVIGYHNNLSTTNCFPTKLYEYLHYKLPIINLSENTWTEHPLLTNVVLSINTTTENIMTIYNKITLHQLYKNTNTQDLYWETEEKKIFRILRLD